MRHRILVVDDDESVLAALRETLSREQYDVTTATNGLEALAKVKSETYAVVLTDQQMPILTGLELLAQVKEIQPHATRLLITAVLALGTVIDAINKGEIYRFIVKPWLREELLATLVSSVQRHEQVVRDALLRSALENERAEKRILEDRLDRLQASNRKWSRLARGLAASLGNTVEVGLRCLEQHQPALALRARRTHSFCKALASVTRMVGQRRTDFLTAALLHDVGLIEVAPALIQEYEAQPVLGVEDKWALIRRHPEMGQQILASCPALERVGRIVRAHHEEYDGKGFPDGLRGNEIPWEARLLAVVCRFLNDPQAPHACALSSILPDAGTRHDPEAVQLLDASLPEISKIWTGNPRRPGMAVRVARGVYGSDGSVKII